MSLRLWFGASITDLTSQTLHSLFRAYTGVQSSLRFRSFDSHDGEEGLRLKIVVWRVHGLLQAVDENRVMIFPCSPYVVAVYYIQNLILSIQAPIL